MPTPQDPRTLYFQPPFKDQQPFDMPGLTKDMSPQPDHGEKTYQGTNKLSGMTALITGGDSGIGRAVALAYAREGAQVAFNYLCEHEDAQETERLIRDAGGEPLVVPGDLRDEAFCKDLIHNVFEHFGRLDILVNNAGYQETREAIDEWSTEVLDRIFRTNIYAPFWLCREALPKMKPGGSILITVSIQSYEPSPNLLPYSLTKSALAGFTKGLAKLAMEQGVRVNAVAPGPVWTPLIPGSMPVESIENFGDSTLFKRPAQPAELAPLYVWLASAEASYLTAEVFGATGGRMPL